MNDDRIVMAPAFRHLGVGRPLGQGINTSGFSWLSVKSKTWTLHHQGETRLITREDDGTPLPYLDVVVVGENPATSKLYYAGAYNDGSASPPDCASSDGIKPDAGVPNRQNPICNGCRHDAWGSASSGKGKACQDHKKVAVLLMPYLTKRLFNGAAMMDPVFLKVPPDSLKPWKLYGDSLVHRGAHWAGIITRIGFAPDKLFQLTFNYYKSLTDNEASTILPLLEDSRTLNLIGAGSAYLETLPRLPEVPEPPQETGILEAFGKASEPTPPAPTQRRPGRPPGSTNKSKTAAAPAAEPPAGNGESVAWDVADAGLDDRMKTLLDKKTDNYLK